MKKIFKIIISILLLIPSISYAAFAAPWQGTSTTPGDWIFPQKINGGFPIPYAPYYIASSTTATSSLPNVFSSGNYRFSTSSTIYLGDMNTINYPSTDDLIIGNYNLQSYVEIQPSQTYAAIVSNQTSNKIELSGTLTQLTYGTLRFQNVDCSGFTNSGKLTVQFGGNVVCGNDVSGSGTFPFTTLTNYATTTNSTTTPMWFKDQVFASSSLIVAGGITASEFTATTTNATSTFSGNISVLNTSPQGLSIFNTAATDTNYERARMFWSGNIFNILTGSRGTGSARAMRIGVDNAGTDSVLSNIYLQIQRASSPAYLFNSSNSPTQFVNGQIIQTSMAISGQSSGRVTGLQVGGIGSLILSGTASYTSLDVHANEQTLGSGQNYLQTWIASTTAYDGTNRGDITEGVFTNAGYLGLGSTSPFQRLVIADGNIHVGGIITSTSTTATSTLPNLSVTNINFVANPIVTTTQLFIDGNRIDSYTADGTINRPYKTLSAAISGTPSGLPVLYNLAPGTYVEGAPVTFPNVQVTLAGGGSTIVFASGATFQNAYLIRNVTISGSITFTDTSTTNSHITESTTLSGNLIVNAPLATHVWTGGAFVNGAIYVSTSTSFAASGAFSTNTIFNSGTLYWNGNKLSVTNNTYSAINATTTYARIVMSSDEVDNFGTGGGINCQNSATSSPNEIAIVDINVGVGTPNNKGLNCGAAAVSLKAINLNTTTGVPLIPQFSSPASVVDAINSSIGSSTAQFFVASSTTATTSLQITGIGTSTPGNPTNAQLTVQNSSGKGNIAALYSSTGVVRMSLTEAGTLNLPVVQISNGSITSTNQAYTITSTGNNAASVIRGGGGTNSNLSLVSGNSATMGSDFVRFNVGTSGLTEAARFDTKGSLGIGSTSPYSVLAVSNQYGATSTQLFTVASTTSSTGSTAVTLFRVLANGTIYAPSLTTASGVQSADMCLDASGQFISDSALCLASALRFKERIKTLSPGLNEVLKLKPVSFFYKPEFNNSYQNDPNFNSEQIGFIAEDVYKVEPRLVTVEVSGKDKGLLHSVRYENLTALLTKAIQQFYSEFQNLIARVSGLEKKIDSQQKQIDDLQAQINKIIKSK